MVKNKSYYGQLTKIYDALQDQESKDIFEARLKFAINKDMDEYEDTIISMYNDWECPEMKKAIHRAGEVEGIVIFGCEHDAIRTKRLLDICGYNTEFFCDSNEDKVGTYIDGIQVISVEKVIAQMQSFLVVIGSQTYGRDVLELLQKNHFPEKNILMPGYGKLIAKRGEQYFDVFDSETEEIYIDAGAWIGDTFVKFLKWCNAQYAKAYLFEPLLDTYGKIKDYLSDKDYKNVELHNKAVWNEETELNFSTNNDGSAIREKGDVTVDTAVIDHIVGDEKVTFIKMDIEGSEYNALVGSRNTILRNRPKLAICIYHKPEDFIELSGYILDLVPEYKLYIRQYNSNTWETVLYAVI